MAINGKDYTELILITNNGVGVTGLSPTFTQYKDITDPSSPTDYVPQPAIYEIGGGQYAFKDNQSDMVIAYKIDAGASLPDEYRYIDGVISWEDVTDTQRIIDIYGWTSNTWGKVNTDLDATISSRLASADYVAPDNATIAGIKSDTTTIKDDTSAIKTETDKIQPDIISVPDNYKADVSALSLEATSQAIKTETDKIQPQIIDNKDAYKADVSGVATQADQLQIKSQTDKLIFDTNNYVEAHTKISDSAGISNGDAELIADKVWDETATDHNTSGTFGAKNQLKVPSENVNDYKADVSALALQSTAAAIKNQTDKMIFDSNNYIESTPQTEVEVDLDLADKLVIRDAVWNADRGDYNASGTFGETNQTQVPSANVDDYKADITSLESTTNGIKSQTDRMVFDSNNYVKSNPQEAVSIVDADKNDVVDRVWNELAADHVGADTFGDKLQNKVPSADVDDYKATGFATDSKIDDAITDINAHTSTEISGHNTNVMDELNRIEGAGFDPNKSTLAGIYTEVADTGVGNLTNITEQTLDDSGNPLGRILDGDGNPITGARINAYLTSDADLSNPRYYTTSDGDGGFVLVVDKGATYKIYVVSTNYSGEAKIVTV